MNKIGLMMVIRNEKDRILDCLNHHLPYIDEVVICDQMSDDGTWEIINHYFSDKENTRGIFKYKLFQDKNYGYSEPSKQKSADLLNSDWILYIDPDETFQDGFLFIMRNLIEDVNIDGYWINRHNTFNVRVYDDNVPIEPKWLKVSHPSEDPQLRLTRKKYSLFPQHLHHRVRVKREDGKEYTRKTNYWILHEKTLDEQWFDNNRYTNLMKNGKGVN